MMAPEGAGSYLAFAEALTHRVSTAIRAAQRRGFNSHIKPDGSVVTDVDQEIERVMRRAILRRYPEHSILGEEWPPVNGNGYCWILDPIDGTDNFVSGIPTFGSLLSLYRADEPVVATLSHPQLHLEYSAARGAGVFVNGKRLQRRSPDTPSPIVVTNAPENFARHGGLARLTRIQEICPNTRIYRDCFAHSRVLVGAAVAGVDANVQRWDIAATRLLIEEAGGDFVEYGRWTSPAGIVYYTVVFGDPDWVERLCRML